MHIMIIAQQWAPEYGVPQLRGSWCAKQLIEAGHSVDVITAPPHYPNGQILSDDPEVQVGAVAVGDVGETIWRSNFHPHSASIPSRMIDQAVVALSSISTAKRAAQKRRPNLIIASAPPLPSAFTARVIAEKLGVPLVVDVRDAWPDLARFVSISDYALKSKPTLRSKARQPAILAGARAFSQILSSAAGLITTTSVHTEELAYRYGKPAVTISNIEIISLPSDSSVSPHGAVRYGAQEGIADLGRPLRVLYAGTVGRAQDIGTLISAAHLAIKNATPIDLTIAGTGAHLRLAREQAIRMHVPVRFLGRVNPEVVQECYDWADIVTISLRAWDPLRFTMPSKTFELIASGKYVLGAVEGACAQVIKNAGAGSAVPPGDPEVLAEELARLARNPQELSKNYGGAYWVYQTRQHLHSAETLCNFLERVTRGFTN